MEIKYRNNNKEIFAPLKNAWLIATPEEIIRQKTICRLVNDYGYDLNQMEQEVGVTNSKRGTGSARADIVIWKNEQDRKDRKSAFIVVECKAENVKLIKEDFFQGLNYATWAKATFFVITNQKNSNYFKVIEDKMSSEMPTEILEIPKAEDIDNVKKLKEILGKLKVFSREEFQKLLFECHNVIRNNDKLSPEMAFDEISKILFMKIQYERKEENSIFSKAKFLELRQQKEDLDKQFREGKPSDEPYYQLLFKTTKEAFENDDIFENNDRLRIREVSFLNIVEKLQNHNLSETSDDVKGIAFEEFLGTTFRGELGQFFTPRTLVDFMVEVLDPQENELICDPCCGSGGFLIKSFEYVREKIEKDIQQAKENIKNELLLDNYTQLSKEQQQETIAELNQLFAELNKDLDKDVTEDINGKPSRANILSSKCIFGTDAESRSARTAKMNMIMHGDGHGGVHFHDGLLNINGIYQERFDVVISNPPFGARVAKDFFIKENELIPEESKRKYYENRYGNDYINANKKIVDRYHEIFNDRKTNVKNKENDGIPLLSLYETGEFSTLTEVLFVERCLNLLKPGGRLGIVLPEGFLNGSDLQRVREYVEGRAKLLLIVSVPQDVFVSAGAMVKSSLVFLKKFTDKEESLYRQIVKDVTKKINDKYQPEIDEREKVSKKYWHEIQRLKAYIKEVKSIKTSKSEKDLQFLLTNGQVSEFTILHKEAKAEFDKWLKETNAKKEIETKAEIKNRFDYDILMSQIDKAGITSTGQKTENQLVELKDEFTPHRKSVGLWKSQTIKYEYSIGKNGKLVKTPIEKIV